MMGHATDPADLAIVIVSTNEAHWLEPCLRTIFERAGGATLDVVVVDNDSKDGTRELVETKFPAARVVWSENHGFGYANNAGAVTCDARYILFINPDTEIKDGTFGELVSALDARPDVGLAGVRQVDAQGELYPTIRRFPSVSRALIDALSTEKWSISKSWSGEHRRDLSLYDEEVECDWTSGSFMLARREALLSSGLMDERFFIYSEEPDLCLRMKRAGWSVRHLPTMTIIHHTRKGGIRPKMIAQDAYTRQQYARKHFAPGYAALYVSAVAVRHVVRAVAPPYDDSSAQRRAAAKLALLTLGGRKPPPFGAPPETALTRHLPG